MYIITSATGHIGSVVADTLLNEGQEVLVITRSSEKAVDWKQKGATIAVVDLNDTAALNNVFKRGKRLFMLNPPGRPDQDIMADEHRSITSMLGALKDSGIEKIVAMSTYGAQPGRNAADLNTLYDMEQGLSKTGIPFSVIRGAYYMSNWDMHLDTAREHGMIYTMLPVTFQIAMVAPSDIGKYAAKLLREPLENSGIHYVEGPQSYTPADVAEAFSEVLHKRVEAVEIPQNEWISSMSNIGFSEASANAMAEMTRLTVEKGAEKPTNPHKGKTTIRQYVQELVNTHATV